MVPGIPFFFAYGERQERQDSPIARIARVVAPGLPHHVAQRSNRRQQTFSVMMIIEPIWNLWPNGVHTAPGLEREPGSNLCKQKPGPKLNRRSR